MNIKYTGKEPYTCPHGVRTFHPDQTYSGVPDPLAADMVRRGVAKDVTPKRPKPTKAEKPPKDEGKEATKTPPENKAKTPPETK